MANIGFQYWTVVLPSNQSLPGLNLGLAFFGVGAARGRSLREHVATVSPGRTSLRPMRHHLDEIQKQRLVEISVVVDRGVWVRLREASAGTVSRTIVRGC